LESVLTDFSFSSRTVLTCGGSNRDSLKLLSELVVVKAWQVVQHDHPASLLSLAADLR
jgi:hypothetical protein